MKESGLVTKFSGNTIYLKLEKVYFSIAALSLLLIVWQYLGMDRIVEISPSKATVSVSGDKLNGGLSESRLTVTNDGALMHCDINLSSTFAFCSLDISIGDGVNQGVDVSQFDNLNLWLEHNSSQQDTVIVYLKNRERFSSNVDISARNPSNKSNQQTLLPISDNSFYSLPLEQFNVPSWWILLHKATGQAAKPNLTNVISLSIVTGDSLEERTVDIKLKKAVIVGKWISANTLYLILALLWALVITIHASFRVYQLASQLQLKHRQNTSLAELNKFLSIQKDEFELQAKTDPLTGVANRVGTRDLLEQIQQNQDRIYSLIMFDIDYFKAINDNHGHQVGDEVIKTLANVVRALIRDTDHLARWGGEEFIVMCPDTSKQDAVMIAELLRENIAAATFTQKLSVTCSFGVSECKKRLKNPIQRLFESADAAMYRAKKAGRNRVES